MSPAFFRFLLTRFGLALLPVVATAAPERLETPRADGSMINWTLHRPEATGKVGLVVLIQGSGCLPAEGNTNLALLRSSLPDFAALTVEKYGVLPDDRSQIDDTNCSDAFYAHFTISQRVEDYATVIGRLRHSDWWNGTLVLIGGSEGGDVVADLAASTHANAAIMISTGGGKTFGEMVRQSMLDEMKRHSVPRKQWPRVDAEFEKARRNPNSSEVWAGSSYRFWADAIDRRSIDSMLRATGALLLIQGGLDTSAPVEHARLVADGFAKAGRCNLTYWEFPGLDHGMVDTHGNSHMADVISQAVLWLEKRLAEVPLPTCPTKQ